MPASDARPDGMVNVMILDFAPVIREGISAILASDPRMNIVAMPGHAREALTILRNRTSDSPIDVVLTDAHTDSFDGIGAIARIKTARPGTEILVLTGQDTQSYVVDAIRAGAGGYVFFKALTADILLKSVHRLSEGDAAIKAVLLRKAVQDLVESGREKLARIAADAAQLTAREIDVLRLMANGYSNQVIADELGIAPDTAKQHVGNIVEKLRARSRTHAAILGAQAGIIGAPITPHVEDVQ